MIRAALLSFSVFLLNLVPGCDAAEWRQKMVVAVETPEGLKTGESVVEIRFSANRSESVKALPGAKAGWKPRGEAVVVDLGERGTLIALLKSAEGFAGDAGPNATFTFSETPAYAGSEEGIAAVLAEPLGVPVDVPRVAYPLIVTFDDISKPETIRQVDPDDLAASFGEGVRLKSLTLERTDEAVTDGSFPELIRCNSPGNRCVPVNLKRPYDHPLRNVPNSAFRSFD
ncbi:hypothetical protein [Fulvimarina sp. MAC3]|uniref:hypothetical protein n=1 Tax=Fulvimarina sp. MAC3 TaxID=3148887 RepID=UPI0031FCD3EE